MIIHNKEIGIDSNIINNCSDKALLISYSQKILIQIEMMKVRKSGFATHLHSTGEYVDLSVFNKLDKAIKFQGILKVQIQSRISHLKNIEKIDSDFNNSDIEMLLKIVRDNTTIEQYKLIAQTLRFKKESKEFLNPEKINI